MGFIFQKFHLLEVMNAVENVEIPLLLLGDDPASARVKALDALEKVGLGDRSEHRPAELSGVNNREFRLLERLYTSLQ
jgi:putative ABC transport system ATP-binding protein